MASAPIGLNDAILQHAQQVLWSQTPDEQKHAFWLQAASSHAVGANAHDVPRSMSLCLPNNGETPNLDFGSMDRTRSAPSSVPMGRSTSGHFPGTFPNANSLSRRSISAIPAWSTASEDNLNSGYTFAPVSSSAPGRTALRAIDESSVIKSDVVEYTPEQFVGAYMKPSASPSLIIPSNVQRDRLQANQLTPEWSQSYDGSISPGTPSTVPLMTPTLSSSHMSRDSSINTQFLSDLSMMRTASNVSDFFSPFISDEDGAISLSSMSTKTISACDDSPNFFNFTGSGEDFLSNVHVSASASALTSPSSTSNLVDLAEDMQRSPSSSSSNSSYASAHSTSSRHLRRDREIKLQASKVKIAPKAVEPKRESSPTPSSTQMVRLQSQDGSSKMHGVIAKVPYTRPQHPKIRCPQCDDHPSGFRGTHELERHIARNHTKVRKAFICVDASPEKKFLSTCKHCRNKKAYGAYYNAAAHLRRAHFHPRKRGRKGKNDEKRGGSGGGDDPPMDYLRQHWIMEIEVVNSYPKTDNDDVNDANDASDKADDSLEYDVNSYPNQPAADNVLLDFNQQFFDASFMTNHDMGAFELQSGGLTDPNAFQFDADTMIS
ncbi:hypothetical protein EJ04DRAFT_573204 [Polyplosphaeria fusca]|uniref:DUF7896 domain-containing protein n=1 Tax=Polyplosphaeria fusca TaxID=682080 RepID=A0A9P4R976_9PLEO|nr:hypothetical protein EJ04DRAFT_573204 [Polyplosphaeria fusca]